MQPTDYLVHFSNILLLVSYSVRDILWLRWFAVAAALIAFVAARRRPPAGQESSEQLVRAVDEMRNKMDSLAQDLSEALDRAERESRRNRLFGELGGTVDLEELMDRVLDAAMELEGVDAALMSVEAQGGTPAISTRGMTAQEAAKPPTSGVAGALP